MAELGRLIKKDALFQSLILYNFGKDCTIAVKSGNHFVVIRVPNVVTMSAGDGIMVEVN